MRRHVGVVLGVFLAAAGCAGTALDGADAGVLHDVFWRASRQCERRYTNLRVDRIDPTGELTLTGDLDLRANLGEFTRCYHEGIAERVAARRAAGAAVPDTLNLTPAVDLD
jgi:hypothetical protein